jgi:hypothetical protein
MSAESKSQSRNCRNHRNLEVFARVPRLESNYVYICKLQPLYFVTNIFLERPSLWLVETLQSTFCEMLKKRRPSLTTKMAFDRCWRLQYRTQHGSLVNSPHTYTIILFSLAINENRPLVKKHPQLWYYFLITHLYLSAIMVWSNSKNKYKKVYV